MIKNSLKKTLKLNQQTKDKMLALLFILPSLLLISIFVYGFIAWTGFVSFTNWNSLIIDLSWNGLQNYVYLIQDFRFQSDLRNTLFYTILFIGFVVLFGQLFAVLLDQQLKGSAIMRNILLFPMALSFVVTGVVWRWILNPDAGVNLILQKFGASPGWYTDTNIVPHISIGQIEFGFPVALFSVVIAAVWQMTGFALAMYLAGLQSVPEEIKEAGRIDGANEFILYVKIILPQLKSITFGVVMIMLFYSLKVFDLIYSMTGSGANFVTDMLAINMYETTFKANFYGRGAAIAVIMLLMISLFVIPYLYKNRHQDS